MGCWTRGPKARCQLLGVHVTRTQADMRKSTRSWQESPHLAVGFGDLCLSPWPSFTVVPTTMEPEGDSTCAVLSPGVNGRRHRRSRVWACVLRGQLSQLNISSPAHQPPCPASPAPAAPALPSHQPVLGQQGPLVSSTVQPAGLQAGSLPRALCPPGTYSQSSDT